MIEIMPDLPDNILGFTGKGEVTADDYETVLIPAVETKLKNNDKIRLLYHLGNDFTGFSTGAMWDDAKVGLHHLKSYEKIAVVTDIEWLRASTKFFGFTIPGQVKVFLNNQLSEAIDWLKS